LQRYTLEPQGVWAWFNKIFWPVDRSSGIPLNPQFRNPPPAALDPKSFDDPVTVPAADIADNPYWKRDARRNYPKLSSVTQGDMVALLTVGSAKTPKDDVLQIGDAGKNQLVTVQKEGEEGGLAKFLVAKKDAGKAVLGEDGLPPKPAPFGHETVPKYELTDQSYENK
jgi:hypothetical protein